MKILWKLLVLSILFMFIAPLTIGAEESQNAEKTLEKTLQYFVDKDLHSYAENVINERYNTKAEAFANYEEITMYDPVLDFKIIEEVFQEENEAEFLVEIELEDAILREPYKLINSADGWKLLIEEEGLTIDEYEVVEIKNTSVQEKETLTNDLEFGIKSGMVFRTFSGTISNALNTSNFNIPSRGIILNVSRHNMNANVGGGSLYSGFYVMRDTSNRNLHSPRRVTSTGTYSLGLSRLPSRGHLRVTTDIGGNGSYSYSGSLAR